MALGREVLKWGIMVLNKTLGRKLTKYWTLKRVTSQSKLDSLINEMAKVAR